MDAGAERHQVLADYAALLRAFLPEVRGFHCYGTNGTPIWTEDATPPVALTTDCRNALKDLLRGRSKEPIRIPMPGAAAYLVPLCNEKAEPLGALALLLPATADLAADACAERILPATRTLERELSLRVRLLEGRRKLSVQAAEERLLHEVERAVKGPADCQVMLERILKLCRHFLEVESAGLVIPGKDIALIHGSHFSRDELALLVAEEPDTADSGVPDRYLARIRAPNDRVIGILALAGWKGPEFSLRRRSRVGRYLSNHIEGVLERAYDSVTGLPAWPAFEKQLTAALAMAAGDPPVLMYCDIDRLHVANETLGRDTGDQVLARFGAILQAELKGNAVTRIAGDRFAALLVDVSLPEARKLAERVASHFRQVEFGEGDRRFGGSVSIGIGRAGQAADVTGSDDAMAAGALSTAQLACSAAKDRGRGRVEVYEPADVSLIQRFDDIQLVGYIRNAIERSRLVLMAQPIATIRPPAAGPDPVYFEVLVRLLDDAGQHVSPSEFFSAAERYQLMEDLDRWVVATTLAELGRRGPELARTRARFAVNLSGQSLGSEPFLGFVQQQLESSGVPPEMICFEITETVAVANLQRAQAFMHTLRRGGCRFSLDDFGTGLSSFAYLKLFPVDTIKIDGSFIRDLTTNVVSQSVVAAISEVARVMQLETVAEFVEDPATLELLGRLGITRAQGYLLGEPQPLLGRLDALGLGEPASELGTGPNFPTGAQPAAPRSGTDDRLGPRRERRR